MLSAGLQWHMGEKEAKSVPLFRFLFLPQLQLFGFCLRVKGKGSCDVVSWCPGFLDLSLKKREEVLTAHRSLPSFLRLL